MQGLVVAEGVGDLDEQVTCAGVGIDEADLAVAVASGAISWATSWTLRCVGSPAPRSRNCLTPAFTRCRTTRCRKARFSRAMARSSGAAARAASAATRSAS